MTGSENERGIHPTKQSVNIVAKGCLFRYLV